MADKALRIALAQDAPIPLDVAFQCGAGQVLAIFGPSGSGKTTILRTIAGLYAPRRARVSIGETVWLDTAAGIDVPPHRRAVGFVFQDYALFPHLTALGNVLAALGHRPHDERRQRALDLLRLVHLDDRAGRRPAALSGGERQRVAVARALAREPQILLLDEPFAAVDRTLRRRLQDEIDQIRQSLAIPLVLVTHDFEDVIRLATDVVVLDRGRGVAQGALIELASRPDMPWLQETMGLGSVLDATVVRVHAGRGLAELSFEGGVLFASGDQLEAGAPVRVRIPAREVILASAAPHGLSVHNVLVGTVAAVSARSESGGVVVQLAIGASRVLAEVTQDAVDRLEIVPGRPLHALIKSMSLDVRATAAGPAPSRSDT